MEIRIKTKRGKEVVDITDEVNAALKIKDGLCHLFLLHTTAALTTADLDPGTDLDMLDAFEALIPKYSSSAVRNRFSNRASVVEGLPYRHPHDPSHVPDHILSSLIGASLTLPVEKGKLRLGMWQRVVLIEFDGPREREIVLTER